MTASARRRPRAAVGSHSERVLVLDVGNSKVAYGLYRGIELECEGRLPILAATAVAARRQLVRQLGDVPEGRLGWRAVLSSVVPAATRTWRAAVAQLIGRQPLVLGPGTALGLTLRVPEPRSIGPDRIANALAVQAVHRVPAIVVDLGTATTFDCLDARGRFVGGAIAPGAALGGECLHRGTARLPAVVLRPTRRALGKTTEEALLSGLVLGHVALVDGMVARLARELGGRPRVIATGGLAPLLGSLCARVHVVDPSLTLRGLLEADRRRRDDT